MKHDKKTMNLQRRILSVIGFFLPFSIIFGFIAPELNGPEFWWSISAMYYSTAKILMIMPMAIFVFFLYVYLGYDIGDRCTCCFSATMALLVLVFPCKCWASGETTGIFNLPTGLSHILHCVSAAFLFASFAYMIGWRFTKHDNALVFTEGKARKNAIYHVCTVLIILGMASQFITSFLDMGWMTIVNETIMLWAFSFAWGVKSDLFEKWLGK